MPFAHAVKEATGVNTIAVGLITDARQAEEIVASGKADLVAMALRHALRSTLAVACRGGTRCDGPGTAPVLARGAAWAESLVRRNPVGWPMTESVQDVHRDSQVVCESRKRFAMRQGITKLARGKLAVAAAKGLSPIAVS